MTIPVWKQADVFVREEIDGPEEMGRQAPGLERRPYGELSSRRADQPLATISLLVWKPDST